jgi:hypothetical protein
MPFNRDTYHANRAARDARKGMATARDIKARAAKGEAYPWEPARIPGLIKVARIDWHLYLMYRSFKPGRPAPRKL